MNYAVIEAFVDLQDGNHVYRVGDEYPRPGYDVTLSRINELTSATNRIGKPLIAVKNNEKPVKKNEKVENKVVEAVKSDSLTDKVKAKGLSKTEINRMTTAELQELAKELEVDGADEMSGNQIKKMLNGALED